MKLFSTLIFFQYLDIPSTNVAVGIYNYPRKLGSIFTKQSVKLIDTPDPSDTSLNPQQN